MSVDDELAKSMERDEHREPASRESATVRAGRNDRDQAGRHAFECAVAEILTEEMGADPDFVSELLPVEPDPEWSPYRANGESGTDS